MNKEQFLQISDYEFIPWSHVAFIERREDQSDITYVHYGRRLNECYELSGEHGRRVWGFVRARACPRKKSYE